MVTELLSKIHTLYPSNQRVLAIVEVRDKAIVITDQYIYEFSVNLYDPLEFSVHMLSPLT